MDRIRLTISSQLDERLTMHDMELLRSIWVQFAGHSFERKRLAAMTAERRSGAEQLLSLYRLQRYGWITMRDNAWGEVTYAVASDKYEVIQAAFFLPSAACFVDQPAEVVTEARPGILLCDLMLTAVFLVQEGLPLTSKGRLHKKNVSRLSTQLLMREEETAQLVGQNPLLEGCPSSAAWVIDLLQELGLVKVSQHALELDEQAWMTWLVQGKRRQERLAFEVLRKRASLNRGDTREQPDQQHVRELVCHAAFQPGVWFDVHQLLEEAIQQGLLSSDMRDTLEQQLSAMLHVWAKLGLGTAGLTPTGELCYCWAIQANSVKAREQQDEQQVEQEELFYVQADYEVLVPPGASMLTRWRLLLFCKLISFDQLTVLRIEQAGILRALKGGLTIGEIVNFLAKHSCTGLPYHIQVTLEQWDAAWQQNEQFSGVLHTAHQGSPVWFLEGDVNEQMDSEEHVERQLNWAAAVIASESESVSQPLPIVLEPDVLFPGFQSIPSMWHEQFRTYHSSTAWQMIEQAHQWHTKVILRLGDSTVEYIPRKLYPERQQVEGNLLLSDEDARWITLSPNDWKEMKLVVAPFN